jgi:hypothetical protein
MKTDIERVRELLKVLSPLVSPLTRELHGHVSGMITQIKESQKKIAHRNGEIVMAGFKVAELEAECAALRLKLDKAETVNASLREYCRLCDIEAAERGK